MGICKSWFLKKKVLETLRWCLIMQRKLKKCCVIIPLPTDIKKKPYQLIRCSNTRADYYDKYIKNFLQYIMTKHLDKLIGIQHQKQDASSTPFGLQAYESNNWTRFLLGVVSSSWVTVSQQDVVQPVRHHTVCVHQVTDGLQHGLEVSHQ